MKKFLLPAIIILSLCACSNTANTRSLPAAVFASARTQVGLADMINKCDYDNSGCGYEIREGDPAEPVKKDMPIDWLPSQTDDEPIIENEEDAREFDNRPKIQLLGNN